MIKRDWLVAAGITAFAALLYFIGMAGFAYPGESAQLLALWNGLDRQTEIVYPLMAIAAKLFGGGNLLAPVCGTVSVALVFLLSLVFTRRSVHGDASEHAMPAGMLAAVTAALVYLASPAVRSAATHLEPRMFDTAWALAAFALSVPWARVRGRKGSFFALAIGVMWGLGAADTLLFVLLLPLALLPVVKTPATQERTPYPELVLFAAGFLVAFFGFLGVHGALDESLRGLWRDFAQTFRREGWLAVLLLTTLPFFVTFFSAGRAFRGGSTLSGWIFHLALTLISVLAVATPFSASSVMEVYGVLPVTATVFAALTAGYLVTFWYLGARMAADRRSRLVAWIVLAVYGFVLAFNAVFALFAFDSRSGAFADRMAEVVLDDLGDRSWLVTDGLLDNHLRLVAARRGRPLDLVCLGRDTDREYLDDLTAKVRERRLGGDASGELALTLSLGVLPFVQDWLKADPEGAKGVAVVGAPDLWYSAGLKPVPEFAFFGCDPARPGDWSRWTELAKTLEAPPKWGSYRLGRARNPVDRMRFNLRRHMGLVANNRGVWLQDAGRDDEAEALYERVLDEIDADNVSTIFNLFEMANSGHPKAASRKPELERRLRSIVEDRNRRYQLWALSTYYGYIRNPTIFIRNGLQWARSGRPGEALSQVRRAVDFIPTDSRSSIMNMMAAIYASADDRAKSRELYEQVIAKNAADHDALVGMMRLSLMEGDSAGALGYLERAVEAGGDDPRVAVERAMVALMKNDLVKAKALLRKVTDANPEDLRAWSLLAAVILQQCDAEKDPAARAAVERELEQDVLPAMQKQATGGDDDYYVLTTRAFSALRKGVDGRREARDAFAAAAVKRPDVAATQDLVLGLDISLNDPENAELHAKEVLRRDRKAPLANYILGSIALGKGELDAARSYLHKAADAAKPVPMAMNDLAETYRRERRWNEAENYARRAVKADPTLYVAYETLASVLIEAGRDLEEAKGAIEKSIELSRVDGRVSDARLFITLARLQMKTGDVKLARSTLRKIQSRLGELSEFERGEYDALLKDVR